MLDCLFLFELIPDSWEKHLFIEVIVSREYDAFMIIAIVRGMEDCNLL